ncbi:cysteine proteinase 2-like [Aristolochia californica]|uniref:cysteine proteinase 2-like n=1 Tax=Aristolochia californica TaxID=171875 RepID=UPI0035E2C6D9
MATRLALCSFLFLCLAFLAARAASDFVDENPLQLVTDQVHDLELTIRRTLGSGRRVFAFARFAQRYGKKYNSVAEIKKRFGIFVESLELIYSVNRKPLPYTLGINQFADMSWDEFQAHRLGASQNCSAAARTNHRLREVVIPETKDWREDGIVSPVKAQGHCGSCWTFSATGALEAAYTQATGKEILLSEQQLVDCAFGFDNNGCRGGLPSHAFEYIKYNGGLDTEESYPYTASNGICRFKPEHVGIKVHASVNITEGDEEELKYAVGVVRPVSIAFQVIPEFRLYKGGVFTSTTCRNGPMDVNHAVLAVGYGVEKGVPYWIVKNSWGKEWGLDGYFKIEMGKNMCGVATCSSYPTINV